MTGLEGFRLQGKSALVVGGSRGIGRAIALQLARSGARVIVNYVRDMKAAEELAGLASRESLKIDLVRADVSRDAGVKTLFGELDQKLTTPLSVMVFAAATGVHGPAHEVTTRHFDFTFALNVRAFLDIAQQCRGRMTQGGSIVALSSEGAQHGIPTYSLVGASKGALESLCRHLAIEWGAEGIRVNTLSPGTVATDVWNALPNAEQRLAHSTQRSPRGRLTSLEEVAMAAQFLCSDAASGVSGTTLVVDGGARVSGA